MTEHKLGDTVVLIRRNKAAVKFKDIPRYLADEVERRVANAEIIDGNGYARVTKPVRDTLQVAELYIGHGLGKLKFYVFVRNFVRIDYL